ncbi:MAG: hypothetical protein F6K42_00250 [Leptolyngbya sp. SIO1D8]|nr:hypothetical protein [Leptolyngbya sp. SIO1D8]
MSFDIPPNLLGLKYPWNQTNTDHARKYIINTRQAIDDIPECLFTLKSLLEAHIKITSFEGVEVSQSIIESYIFLFYEFTCQMPTFDSIDQDEINACLNKFTKLNPTQLVKESILIDWLNYIVFNLMKFLLNYVEAIKKERPQSFDVNNYIDFIWNYIEKVDPELAKDLIANLTVIGWEKMIPLLEQIISNQKIEKDIRDFAENYKHWIISSRA